MIVAIVAIVVLFCVIGLPAVLAIRSLYSDKKQEEEYLARGVDVFEKEYLDAVKRYQEKYAELTPFDLPPPNETLRETTERRIQRGFVLAQVESYMIARDAAYERYKAAVRREIMKE